MDQGHPPIDRGEQRVEVHVRPAVRQLDDHHPARTALAARETPREPLHAKAVRPLGKPDRDHLRREDQHVSALEAGPVQSRDEVPFGGRVERVEVDRRRGQPGVEAEDRARQQRLAVAGGRGHRREDDAAPDDDLRVALEAPVGQGRELVELVHPEAVVRRIQAHAAHEHVDQFGRRGRNEPLACGGRQVLGHGVEDVRARFSVRQRLRQQVLREQQLRAKELQHALEAAVLLARAVAEEDVVEEQLLHHRRDHAVDFRSRLVDQHLPQAADLRGDARPSRAQPRAAASARSRSATRSSASSSPHDRRTNCSVMPIRFFSSAGIEP